MRWIDEIWWREKAMRKQSVSMCAAGGRWLVCEDHQQRESTAEQQTLHYQHCVLNTEQLHPALRLEGGCCCRCCWRWWRTLWSDWSRSWCWTWWCSWWCSCWWRCWCCKSQNLWNREGVKQKSQSSAPLLSLTASPHEAESLLNTVTKPLNFPAMRCKFLILLICLWCFFFCKSFCAWSC